MFSTDCETFCCNICNSPVTALLRHHLIELVILMFQMGEV